MNHRLREDDAVDAPRAGAVAFAHRHLLGTADERRDDDQHVVHHRREDQGEGDERQHHVHPLDRLVFQVRLAYRVEGVVDLDPHLFQFLNWLVFLAEGLDLFLDTGNGRSRAQLDEGGVGVVTDIVH